VAVVQARNDPTPARIDDPGLGAGHRRHLLFPPDRRDPAVTDRNRFGRRVGSVERRNPGVE